MSRRRQIAWGTLLTALGMVAGAFIQWSATERRLSIHIAQADDKVVLMCDLADYSASSEEYRNTATDLQCVAFMGREACPRPPSRPTMLRREVLSKRCP